MMRPSTPSETAPTPESTSTSFHDMRTRIMFELRSLQPGEWAERVRSSVESYIDFVRTTLTART